MLALVSLHIMVRMAGFPSEETPLLKRMERLVRASINLGEFGAVQCYVDLAQKLSPLSVPSRDTRNGQGR